MSDIAFIEQLEEIVSDRLRGGTDGSYTAGLAAAGTKRVAQKVGEEAVELALASMAGNRDEIVAEAADLVYHVIVLLRAQGLRLADVATVLENRHVE